MAKLEDDSLMPWGIHKGTQMADVPASYLLWCYDNSKVCQDVKDYVEENIHVLRKEAEKEKQKHNSNGR